MLVITQRKRDGKNGKNRKRTIKTPFQERGKSLFFRVPKLSLQKLVESWKDTGFETDDDRLFVWEPKNKIAQYIIGIEVENLDIADSQVVVVIAKRDQRDVSWLLVNEMVEPFQSKMAKIISEIRNSNLQ